MQVQLLRSSDTWLSLELNFYPVLVKNLKSLGHEVREIQTTEFPYLGIPKFVDSHLLTFKGFGSDPIRSFVAEDIAILFTIALFHDSFHNRTISRIASPFFSSSNCSSVDRKHA